MQCNESARYRLGGDKKVPPRGGAKRSRGGSLF